MGKIAFVFAGQGAQYPGMGREIYDASVAAHEAMDRAEQLRPGTLEMCFSGDAESLNQTINTQPCMFLVDYACALAAREAGVSPDCAAGFSLGEVAAATFAGMLSFEDGFKLVVRRAELMQSCAERRPGAMAAVLRLNSEQVEALCAEFDEVYPVNYNCPGQTVITCAAERLAPFSARVAELRGRAVKLKVSGAFHSPYMLPATEGLSEYLKGVKLNPCAIPLYANKTARPYAGDHAALLAGQVSSPVLWQASVEHMIEDGVDTFVEVGAGNTLSGLIAKINAQVKVYNVADMQGLKRLSGARAEGAV